MTSWPLSVRSMTRSMRLCGREGTERRGSGAWATAVILMRHLVGMWAPARCCRLGVNGPDQLFTAASEHPARGRSCVRSRISGVVLAWGVGWLSGWHGCVLLGESDWDQA